MLTTKNSVFKKFICHLTIVVMLFTAFSFMTVTQADEALAYNKVCKIKASKLVVRKGAGNSYKSIGTLKKGTYKLILSSKKDKKGVTWYRVYKGSKKGYINSKYVNIMSLSSTKLTGKKATVNVSSGSLIVRKGPGTIYGKLGTVKKGKVYTVKTKTKDVYGNYWYSFTYNGKTAYASSKYMKLNSTSSASTTTTSTTTQPTTKPATTTTTTTPAAGATTPTTVPSTEIKFTVTKVSMYGKVNVSSGNLNIRKGPSTAFESVGLLAKNTAFTITGKTTVNDVVWYQLDFAGITGYACGTYVVTSTSKPTGVTIYDGSKTMAARKAACDWAVKIANDNTFHYGETKWAHHNGCYFCGTNTSTGSAKLKDGATKAQAEKTYCCNPFVTAAYCHGAGAKEVNCKDSSMRFGLANDSNKIFTLSDSWVKVTKTSTSDLLAGDILMTPSHCMLYIGDGKIAHAGHHDNGVKNDYWNDSISVEKLPASQWSRTSKIYRYIGVGKY
ncbi:MAG: SH3 domain-containing protein [Eubacterium sp.]|nr:SH3 domain-containing protein [Candidatus Colimonas fimequi]